MILDMERNAECTVGDQPEQRILRHGQARQQMHGLRQHGLAHQERRRQPADARGDPAVVPFGPVEKCDERSGINDGGVHRGRSPRGAGGSSQGPELQNPPRRARPS